jgi:hypothetical protein
VLSEIASIIFLYLFLFANQAHPNPFFGRQAFQRRGRNIIQEVLPVLLYEVEISPHPLPRQASSPEERENDQREVLPLLLWRRLG